MKISVVIPTYNASTTIQATLDSVLRQTITPYEILVLDDGSIDDTLSLLHSYSARVTIFQESHKGVANARNVLCDRTKGDLIAFLDSDDIWHPRYLEFQSCLFRDFPNAVAFFTGHVDFHGYLNYQWETGIPLNSSPVELIPPSIFLERYNRAAGPFASMSYCCIPKRVLMEIGREPFCSSGAEDTYLFYLLVLLGPVVYTATPLVAYRMTEKSLSANRLTVCAALVRAMELLDEHYNKLSNKNLFRVFRLTFATKRREYGKILMGAGKILEARTQFWQAVKNSKQAQSMAKSLALLLFTYMPVPMQPTWPSGRREWGKNI